MQKLLTLTCLLISLQLFSQNLQGKVYDDEAIVSGVKVLNKTKTILTYTDESGNFQLEASVTDSIVFFSLFHHEKTVVLTKTDFHDVLVIELKKAVNDLDEVLIKKEPDFKPFDAVEANTTLKNQILEDIKRNPHLYPENSAFKGNIFGIIGLVAKLFKSKKPKEPAESYVSYDDLVSHFEKDIYFNEKLLRNDLKIPNGYKHLFFQFCETNAINSKLLLIENRFLLLDTLLIFSNEFLEILAEEQTD